MIPGCFPAAWADCVLYLFRSVATTSLKCVISLDGHVDEARLRRAVRLSLDAEPILGCRFVEHWYQPYWQRRADLDQVPLCEVVETADCRRSLSQFLVAPLDAGRDPLIAVKVFRGATDMVCVKVAHEVADGPSVKNYVALLFGLYRRLKADPCYQPPPNLTGIRNVGDIAGRLSFPQRLAVFWKIARRTLGRRLKSAWLFPPCRGDGSRRGYLVMRFAPERMRALEECGRLHQATITAVMLAGFCRALQTVCRPAAARAAGIHTTIDIRRFLPPEQRSTAISNISSALPLSVDVRRETSFGELVESMRDQLAQALVDPAGGVSRVVVARFPLIRLLSATIPFALVRRLARRRQRRLLQRLQKSKQAAGGACGCQPKRAGIINFGRFDPELSTLDGLSVTDMYLAGPLLELGGIFVGFSGFGRTGSVSLGFSNRVIDEAVARDLLAQLDRALPLFTGVPAGVSSLMAEPAE